MEIKRYNIQYLNSFSEELEEILNYISYILKNEKAANNLLNNIIVAINKRSENPKSFEKYKSKKILKYEWYRIYIGNFTIFYTVKEYKMIVAHIFYSARDIDKLI